MSIPNLILAAFGSFVAAIFVTAAVLGSMKTWTERGMTEKQAMTRTDLIVAAIFFLYVLAEHGVLWKR
jgi:uncharacterized membrane protein YphA (DoxX/SURF4 family)